MKILYFQIPASGIDLKLTHKIYLLQFILALILFAFLTFVYLSYEKQYNKDIDNFVNNETEFKKKEILKAIADARQRLHQQKKFYAKIHTTALHILQKKPNYNLNLLKKQLRERFHLEDTHIEIYLIDKNYTIFKTTYPKDLGFNLFKISDAKKLLDKTKQDKKIHIADIISIDALDMGYKLYSYAYLRNGIFLELGFTNKRIKNSLPVLIENNPNITIYTIEKNNKNWYYYKLSVKSTITEKKNLYRKIKKFPLNNRSYDDKIIDAHLLHKTFKIKQADMITVITPLYNKNMYKKIGRVNLVMKLKIDISDKTAILKKTKNIFIFSLILVTLFLFFAFLYIRNNFTKKIDMIVESIYNRQEITDASLIKSSDELSIIAKQYNTLFASLNKEIEVNKKLLNENKRFIADTVHQIRTPLTNIMMNGEMVKKFQTDNTLSNFIEQIDASVNMLSNSYEDLAYITSYSTIEYKPTQLDLSTLLSRRIAFFTTISKVNFTEVIANIEEDLFTNINEIECERIIDNNLSNGIKYSRHNKSISVNLYKKANKIIMEFKTFGRAIQEREKVFEKNYRENESKRGLGLGLNMVKNICHKYNIKYILSYKDEQNIFIYTFDICL